MAKASGGDNGTRGSLGGGGFRASSTTRVTRTAATRAKSLNKNTRKSMKVEPQGKVTRASASTFKNPLDWYQGKVGSTRKIGSSISPRMPKSPVKPSSNKLNAKRGK